MKKESMKEHMRERFGGKSELSIYPPAPASLNIELNNTCNQRCLFCQYHGENAKYSIHEKPSTIPLDYAKRILEQAIELGIGKKELGLYFAGEAMLYSELPEIVSYAKGLGFPYVFITSNGSLASIDKVKKLLEAGLDSIRFSVNAADAETYKRYHGKDHFEIVKQNVYDLYQYTTKHDISITTSISCVITKETIGIQDAIKTIFGKYVDEIIFIPLSLSNLRNLDYFKANLALVNDENTTVNRDFVCPLIFNTMYINAFKQVFPCCEGFFYSIAQLDDEIDLLGAWNNERMKQLREIFVGGRDDEGTICQDCYLRRNGVEAYILE